MVKLTLDDYTLSSALPDSFEIRQLQGDYAEVAITLQGQRIYSAKLYQSDGVATFYELRQIIEQNMIARGLVLASLEISTVYDGTGEEIDGKYIIFSRYKNTEEFDINFLESHFLVNRTYYTMPRDKSATLPFFSTGYENLSVVYNCELERDGEHYSYSWSASMYHGSYPSIFNVSISPAYVKNLADERMGRDAGKLLSFTIRVGTRTMRVFVIDDEPCAHFYFRNAYNVTESVFIFGTTNFKTEVSRKEAVSQNVTSFYDKTVTRKWDVKTVPLSMEEALWYNEFLESDMVTTELSTEIDRQEILISDITSEISDSAKDQVSIKFSYRFNDNAYWLKS